MKQPEPCLSGHCRSPLACDGFGYCRERNLNDHGPPTEAEMQSRRNLALGAKIHAESVARRYSKNRT